MAIQLLTSAVAGLKRSPALLFLLVFNILVIGSIVYIQAKRTQHMEGLFKALLQHCSELNDGKT